MSDRLKTIFRMLPKDKTEQNLLSAVLVVALIYVWLFWAYRWLWLNDSVSIGLYLYPAGGYGRPPLYALFARSMQFLGLLPWVQVIQLTAFFSSLGFALIHCYRWCSSKWVVWAFFVMMILNYQIVRYCFFLMTEGFSVTILLMMIGLLCRYFRTKKRTNLEYFSLMIGLGFMIRPVLYGFGLGVLFLFWWFKISEGQWHLRRLRPLMFPMIGCWLLSALLNYANNGFFSNSHMFGEMLLGKAGLVLDEGVVSSQPRAVAQMLALSKPVQNLLKQTDDWKFKNLIAFMYYDNFRYDERILALYWPYEGHYLYRNNYRSIIANEIIRQRPWDYLKLIALNYVAIWNAWDRLTPKEKQDFEKVIQDEGGLPNYGNIEGWNATQKEFDAHIMAMWTPYLMLLRFTFRLVWILSVGFSVVTLYRWLRKKPVPMRWGPLLVVGALIHGVLTATVVFNNSAFRYSLVMWPGMAFVLVLGLWCLWRGLRSKEEKVV